MDSCLFCNFANDDKGTILFENDLCVCIENHDKVLIGSCIIIPKAHKVTVFDLDYFEWEATKNLIDTVKSYLDEKYKPDGYNVGWNCGYAGGQDVFHAHLHIIPRYNDEPYAGCGIRNWIKREENTRLSLRAGGVHKSEIVQVDIIKDSIKITQLLRDSFIDVAEEMGFTPDNCPNHVAFITHERVLAQLGNEKTYCFGIRDAGKWIGFVAVAPYGDSYEITRLAVAPKYRHKGYGRALIDRACDKARELGLKSIGLGMLNDNVVLKKWYEAQGFIAGEPFIPAGASFTACGMSKQL